MKSCARSYGKIKILRIIARLNIGGPAIQAIFLNKFFNNDPFQSKLIYGTLDKDEGDMKYLPDYDEPSSIYVKELGRAISPIHDLMAFIRIFFIILRERPHLIHTHTAKAGTIGRLAGILSGVPVKIHTMHGHIFDGYFASKKTRFFQRIESVLAGFTDKLIVLSPALKNEIMDRLRIRDADKVAVIPLGIDSDLFLNADSFRGGFRKELGISEGTKLVGVVGRLVPIKNHRMFIDAARIVLKETPPGYDIKFLIIGDGEMREELIDYVRDNGVSDNFIFTGWRKDLNRIYTDLDVVVNCSVNEGTPVSLIEAMLSARPIVATDVGGTRDIIFDPNIGYLVKSGDKFGMALSIIKMLVNKSDAEKMGLEARKYARGIYRKERLAEDLKKLYKNLLNKKGVVI